MPEKHEYLQAFLDLQKMAGEWFDQVESDTYVVSLDSILDLNSLLKSLTAIHTEMVFEFVSSRRALDESFTDALKELGVE